MLIWLLGFFYFRFHNNLNKIILKIQTQDLQTLRKIYFKYFSNFLSVDKRKNSNYFLHNFYHIYLLFIFYVFIIIKIFFILFIYLYI